MSELMGELRSWLRSRHYSRRTEESYCLWIGRFIRFQGLRHPAEMAEPEINAFLTHLAVEEKSTSGPDVEMRNVPSVAAGTGWRNVRTLTSSTSSV